VRDGRRHKYRTHFYVHSRQKRSEYRETLEILRYAFGVNELFVTGLNMCYLLLDLLVARATGVRQAAPRSSDLALL
jgi:hypothetical protein